MPKDRPARGRKQASSAENLPDAELDVLACLWDRGQATAAEIRQRLAPYRPMAHGAVLTLLGRLAEKGLVTREKSGQGKSYAFLAVHNPAASRRRILKRLIQRVFDGNPRALLASLLETYSPHEEELKEIRRLLEELRQRDRDQGTKT